MFSGTKENLALKLLLTILCKMPAFDPADAILNVTP